MSPDKETCDNSDAAPDHGIRVGLMGGTFDPVHIGHLRAALEASAALGLERVYVIPAAKPPHKTTRRVSSAAHRLAMANLAVAGAGGLEVSDLELQRSGPSYTLDTVETFDARHPGIGWRCLIIGLDAFLEVESWYRFRDLFKRIPMAVLYRPSGPEAGKVTFNQQIGQHLQQFVSKEYHLKRRPDRYVHPDLRTIYPVCLPFLDIAASRIRRLVHGGRSIRFLVPAPVEDYIYQKGLYR